MSGLHPALAFLCERVPAARAAGADTLLLDIDGARVEIFLVSAEAARVFFAAGQTRLAYRCSAELPDRTKERLRVTLLDLKEQLAAGQVTDPHGPLPEGGGWTEGIRDGDRPAWRDWAARSYRASVESGRRDECTGLPDCLDMRMRPPIQPHWRELAEAPRNGPCSQCGRARGCASARNSDSGEDLLKPLRHADAGSAELAALRVLAEASTVPLAQAVEAYTHLTAACGDRSLDGALPLEFSVRLPVGERQPDRLRFVSYYPMVTSDAVRREINRGRREAVRKLAARWLTPRETAPLDAWLECTTQTQPATLGLSVGVEMEAAGARLQVYAHPEPNDAAERFAHAAVAALGGSAESIPTPASPPVLVGVALSTNRPPALKLYYHRLWAAREDTGLLPEGLGELTPFNPGWGLAIQEHTEGRAAWVKWDFPVTAHYQVYEQFLAAFWRTTGAGAETVPGWLSGESFSPWPTWASLGRGGWALYFQAR
jgi:hypothetical protein